METLEEKIKKLPPELKAEVEKFIETLLEGQKKRTKRNKPAFRWVGVLKDLREQFSSVELQHEISKWRIQDKQS